MAGIEGGGGADASQAEQGLSEDKQPVPGPSRGTRRESGRPAIGQMVGKKYKYALLLSSVLQALTCHDC